jgi:hypothetical protein
LRSSAVMSFGEAEPGMLLQIRPGLVQRHRSLSSLA